MNSLLAIACESAMAMSRPLAHESSYSHSSFDSSFGWIWRDFSLKFWFDLWRKWPLGCQGYDKEICFCKYAELESALGRSASCIYVLLFEANPAGWHPASQIFSRFAGWFLVDKPSWCWFVVREKYVPWLISHGWNQQVNRLFVWIDSFA